MWFYDKILTNADQQSDLCYSNPMSIPAYLVYGMFIFTVMSFVVSLAAIGVSTFNDEAREKRLKHLETEVQARDDRLLHLESEVTSLRYQIEILKAEGLVKDKKIANQAMQILQMQAQIDDKELQIVELRRQIRPGTL